MLLMLSEEQKENCGSTCHDLQDRIERDPEFLGLHDFLFQKLKMALKDR
jgi:hypothetical protein